MGHMQALRVRPLPLLVCCSLHSEGRRRSPQSTHPVMLSEAELGQHAAGNQQSGGIGRGVVGQADGEAKVGELVGVSGSHHDVTGDGRVDCRAQAWTKRE